MYHHLFFKISLFYFIFVIYLSIHRHTVVNATELLSQNESNSKTVPEPTKSQEKVGTASQIRTVNISDEKVVSPEVHNITDPNRRIIPLDQFNSTAGLSPWMLNIKEDALQRTGYVALGFMSIVLIFFVVRAVRLRQKRSKSRKYGIITSTVSDMEMEPLDRDDDEEEDATLFDAQHKYSLQ